MKKNRTIALVLSLAFSLATVSPALATGVLTFDADTTIALTSPAVNLTILNGSSADTITINAGSLDMVMSSGSTFTVRSTDRKAFTHSSNSLAVDVTCNDTYSQIQVTDNNTDSSSFTISVSSDTCSNSGGSTSGGGGGGGGGSVTPTTPTTTTPTTPTPTVPDAPVTVTTPTPTTTQNPLQQFLTDASAIITGTVLNNAGVQQNASLEASATNLVKTIVSGVTVSTAAKTALTNFISYGTKSTLGLGLGERAGVVNSFKRAYGNVPTTESQWSDAIKIANGRWPGNASAQAINQAKIEFKKIYKREAKLSNTKDNNALTVIAYGLRPSARNLNSEKFAIKTFKSIYGHNPVSSLAWDIVRAIAYSGAAR